MPRRKSAPEPAPPPRRRRGTGSIVRLADGTIRARLPANLDPKRPAREFPPGQMTDAVAWLDGYLHPRPVEPTALVVTLGEWATTWHETYVEAVRPPNTSRTYLYALRQLESLYAVPLADLRRSMFQAAVGTMVQRKIDATTIKNAVGVWRRCLDAAVDDELLIRNPVRRLETPTPSPRSVKRHVTAAEVAALWPKIVGHRFEAAYALLLGCGLRIGEVLGLSWESVDFAGSRVWIGPQWTSSHWRDQPKGHNPHWVTLPQRVRAALLRQYNRRADGDTLVLQSPHSQSFGPRKRKTEIRPWSPSTVRGDLAVIVDELHLDPMTPHAGRRGLVTALLDGGASPAIVAERVGHASPATTLKHYAGQSKEARAAADAMVNQYLGDGPEDDSGTETAGYGV